MKHLPVAVVGLVCFAAVPLAAQPPVERPPAAAPAAQSGSVDPGYTYRPGGRRDPFVSLVGRGSDPQTTSRAPGLAGMLINEVSLKGIVFMKARAGYVAMLQGPDKKTYVVRSGDRLLDGSVKSITADTVVFSQDVNDPLSLVKQREVRKTLRSGGENRG